MKYKNPMQEPFSLEKKKPREKEMEFSGLDRGAKLRTRSG